MRIRTRIRTSSALPALPLALGFVVLYYTENTHSQIDFFSMYPDASVLVQRPIESMYAFAYAVVSATAAWQGARLKEARVWESAPYRKTWQIIAAALVPIAALGWLMLLTPVVMAFVQTPAVPTVRSLLPLLLGMALTVAHALIGFTVGQKVKPLVAAPVLLCLTFVAVAFSHAVETTWLRHLAGEYSAALGFGESATLLSMLAQILPTTSLAVAAAAFWTGLSTVARLAVGASVVALCTASSYLIVKDWGSNPPVSVSIDRKCVGEGPRICMPEGAQRVDQAKRAADETYRMLMSYGIIDAPPEAVHDTMLFGRFTQKPTAATRYLPLSTAQREGSIEKYIIKDSARPACRIPTTEESRKIRFWLDLKVNQTPTFESVSTGDPYYTREKHSAIMGEVKKVSGLSAAGQKSWYRETAEKACEGRP
ncbi:hypothetical protein GCM10010232_35200 [Streptomyces amakusaensis]|uniref:ABC transporter permease n=1 Tax=Streptomyces amakusaensis TaxID=67271 RepID=A0ABW0AGJ3_9ACTN